MNDMGVDMGVAATADPTDPQFLGWLWRAAQDHDYRVVVALVVIGLVWLARRYGGKLPGRAGDFMRSDRGGAVLALGCGVLENVAHAALVGALSAHAVMDGLVNGIMAAGGYATAKKMLAGAPAAAKGVPVLKVVGLVALLSLGVAGCIPAEVATYNTMAVKARLIGVAADNLGKISYEAQHEKCVKPDLGSEDAATKCSAEVQKRVDVTATALKAAYEKLVFVRDMVQDIKAGAEKPKDYGIWIGTALQAYLDVTELLKTLGYSLPEVL